MGRILSDKGTGMKMNRSIRLEEAEAFAVLKQDIGIWTFLMPREAEHTGRMLVIRDST